MPTISLRSFIETGDFGNVRGGWTQQELEDELGPAETHAVDEQGHRFIWKYGDIEFHFPDRDLWMVFFDAFDIPKGWGQLTIEPWIIHSRLTREEGEAILTKQGIDYRVAVSPDPDLVNLVTPTGVELSFIVRQAEYSFPVGLSAVYKRFANAGT